MLELHASPHREYLLTQNAGQKLFVALKLRPEAQAARARPQLSVAFVVDTSGSMREVVTKPTGFTGRRVMVEGREYQVVTGARSKMDLVVEALKGLVESGLMQPTDRMALVKFDDTARVLVPGTPAIDRSVLTRAVESLTQFSGGTQMGAGMREGLQLLQCETGSRRMVVLTDGRTADEEVVREVAGKLAEAQVPVTTIGVGQEWNEDLLTHVTDRTQGKPYHVIPDTDPATEVSLKASDLPNAILGELQRAAAEVVTNVALSVRTVKDVKLERVTRVYPTLNETDLSIQPHPVGNVAAGDFTVFILEFTLPARPACRIRLAQLGVTYEVPGAGYRGELPPQDIVVEFTADEGLTGRFDPEVMQWVQQRNIDALVRQATDEARTNPEQARKTLEVARNITVRLGNNAMTKALDGALGELGSSRTISANTAKTLKIGAKTQTLRMGDQGGLPSDDMIRKMTGA